MKMSEGFIVASDIKVAIEAFCATLNIFILLAVRLLTIDSEHIVASPHNNVSPPLHTSPVCCCQQYRHSSSDVQKLT